MKLFCLVTLLLTGCLPVLAAKQRNTDLYFPVMFRPGAMLTLKLPAASRVDTIIIQPWLSDGSPRERLTTSTHSAEVAGIRIDLNLDRWDLGWVQIIAHRAEALQMQATYEVLLGNTLTGSEVGLVQSVRATKGLRIGYEQDGTKGRSLALMNASRRPIRIETCATDDVTYCLPLYQIMQPHASVVFPISSSPNRYLILKAKGPLVSTLIFYDHVRGSDKTFDVDSKITFGPAK